MVVKQTLVPLSTEQFMKTIENNQSRLMFAYHEHILEDTLRSDDSELDRFSLALKKYPPVYGSELTDNLYRNYCRPVSKVVF
jgi:hypothetical protein